MSRCWRRGRVFICMAAVLAASFTGSGAAQPIYLFATGAIQGLIQGEVRDKGFEGSIAVHEVHHLIRNETGIPSHEPLVFTKQVDRSSPNLYKALDSAELLKMDFHFTRISSTGAFEVYYIIRLMDVKIMALEPITASSLDGATASLPSQERVRVSYSRITIEHPPTGGTTVLINPSVP